MRVVQIINSFGYHSGGAERLVQDLHVDLLAAGIDAHLVALEDCETSGLQNATSLGFSSPYKPGAIMALRTYLTGLTPQPDVVHAHLFPTSACVAALQRTGAIACPVIFTEHNTSNRRREKMLWKALDRIIYSRFKKIYCISDGTKAALLEAYPQLIGKAEVIVNGATLRFEDFSPRSTDSQIQILSVGRLAKQKNYSAALHALAQLKDENIQYTILGEGSQRAELEELVSSLKLSDKVALEGHRSDITPFLKGADILLIPSLWEGFGLVAVEGMNAGLPVVASDVSGLREVVGTQGTCAYLVPPSDPDAMSDALRELIASQQKRHTMGEAAFERAKLFDRRNMTKAYISAYRALIPEVAYA